MRHLSQVESLNVGCKFISSTSRLFRNLPYSVCQQYKQSKIHGMPPILSEYVGRLSSLTANLDYCQILLKSIIERLKAKTRNCLKNYPIDLHMRHVQ